MLCVFVFVCPYGSVVMYRDSISEDWQSIFLCGVILIYVDTITTCVNSPFDTWWRHQMETFSALLALCAGNSPVTGEFPAQRPVTRSLMFSMICAWKNAWVNNCEAGDLKRYCAHYGVIVINERIRYICNISCSAHHSTYFYGDEAYNLLS